MITLSQARGEVAVRGRVLGEEEEEEEEEEEGLYLQLKG